jgi:hypothetical protein
MSNNNKYCCICGKQLVSEKGRNDSYCIGGPITLMGIDQYCCHICSTDLDENGLFPEERSQAQALSDSEILMMNLVGSFERCK